MDLTTKYGEIKQLNVSRDMNNNFHTQAIESNHRSIGIENSYSINVLQWNIHKGIVNVLEDVLGNKIVRETS